MDAAMLGFKAMSRLAVVVVISITICAAAIYDLLKPISNGCIMTYMYPMYIPISSPKNVSSVKYGLYLYHEGWQKIDFREHLKQLNGVPVLFIPGNGGSYKQVRSLAAESTRAFQGGPMERMFYQEASPRFQEEVNEFPIHNQYTRKLDWFSVDLEGEHSAMDGQILEEHTEYVVYAIHRILNQYKESHDARATEGSVISGGLPRSVILVGHSMGGFVARAALVHPHLRKSTVETVLTLSTPHQSPPVALQPSLGHYYRKINQEWKKGYEFETSHDGTHVSGPQLSHVVVASISGGINDYQVRSQLESLDGIVPPSHGFMISSTGMKNVWLSMEHQVILWCNQLVVQVSHTILSLIDPGIGYPFSDTRKRLAVFTKMLDSGIPQSWSRQLPHVLNFGPVFHAQSACPSKVRWSESELERDLIIKTAIVTILAMDGRRRWLDIRKLGSNRRNHFIFVTNLSPCHGVRLHLWYEKGNVTSASPNRKSVVEVTAKMVQIPSRPAPRQIEPGSQTEQASPSAVFWLDPVDMHGFRYLTISVAPNPAFSGRPPPAASMAVGQFFNPDEGYREFTRHSLLTSMHSEKDILLLEDHPLAFYLSFAISLGLFPVKLSLKTIGCGIKKSGLHVEEAGDVDDSKLCKLRCFPPVALALDTKSVLNIYPNLHSDVIVVDSSPALWSSTHGSENSTVLLLVDPHCSYKASVAVSFTTAAKRFLLVYCNQIVGFTFAVIFFALMRQANAWELDLPIPSVISAVESNLAMPFPIFFLAISPIFLAYLYTSLNGQLFPPVASFIVVSIICYLIANGAVIILVFSSQSILYLVASVHVFIKTRWRWGGSFCFLFLHWIVDVSTSLFSFKVLRIVRANPPLVFMLLAFILVCTVHPALGLLVLLLSHMFCCHNALFSHARSKDLFGFGNGVTNFGLSKLQCGDGMAEDLPVDENSASSPDSTRSYGDTQLEIFHHRHGLMILHLLAALMFAPSLVAWLERIGTRQSFPRFSDSVLCIGVILHGFCNSKPEFNIFFPLPVIRGFEVRQGFVYLLAGYGCYLSGLVLAPYMAFFPMAAVGVVSFVFRIMERRDRERGGACNSTRKHSHRH